MRSCLMVHLDGAVAVKYARRAGIPAIVMVGGSDVLLLAKAGVRRKKILDVLRQADRVVAVSEDIARRLERDGDQSRQIEGHSSRRGRGDLFAGRSA